MTDNAQTTIRMPRALLDQFRERHAATYAEHRLSFNGWILSRIQLSFAPPAARASRGRRIPRASPLAP